MNGIVPAAYQPLALPVDDQQHLTAARRVVHWRDQPPAQGQLLQPGVRQFITSRRGHDAVVRRSRRMAQAAVAVHEPQVDMAATVEVVACLVV